MAKFSRPVLILGLSLISCAENQGKIETVKEMGIIKKSINTLKSGTGTIKSYIIEPDSVKNSKKITYVKLMSSTYPEYNNINKFFTTRSPYLLEPAGDFYRVKNLKITDQKNVIHKFDDNPNEVKYFYDARIIITYIPLISQR